jgi:hypothetical protein
VVVAPTKELQREGDECAARSSKKRRADAGARKKGRRARLRRVPARRLAPPGAFPTYAASLASAARKHRDGLRVAQQAGARIDETLPNAAAWVPVSKVPRSDGTHGLFPHFIDRAKPGVIAVTSAGMRFVNEANSYHDFVQALFRASPDKGAPCAWLITDHRAIRAYGLGFVKPRPLPLAPHLKSGYLVSGKTIAELQLERH